MDSKRKRVRSYPILVVPIVLLLLLSACQPSAASDTRAESAASGDVVTAVTFSMESGAYEETAIDLVLDNPSGLPIVYTTDGSLPTASSARATGAITIDSRDTNGAFIEQLAAEMLEGKSLVVDGSLPTATVIRAAVLLEDGTVGPAFTNTYFVNEDIGKLFGGVMVISLVADPKDLLDYDTGIMAKGSLYDEFREENESLASYEKHLVKANYTQKGRDWEREATLELFDGGNELSYEAPCGIRLRGNMSRMYAQKSFNVYFRDSYGMEAMDYALFGDAVQTKDGAPIASYKGFSLRAGGNDTEMLHFRDSLLQDMLKGRDFCTQAVRPAIVFLNGEFYGVFSLNEKYSADYIESHYGIDSGNVVIFEDGELDEGEEVDQALYDQLVGFAERDLSDDVEWEQFCSIVDVRSMADYYAAQLYIGNNDLSERKNIRLWRVRDAEAGSEYGDGRWRFMAFDLEYSAGLYGQDATRADYDTVARCMDNSPLLASAMRSREFRSMMRERLEDLARNTFEPTRAVDELESWWVTWRPWIDMTIKRFETDPNYPQWDLGLAKAFFEERPQYIMAYYDEDAAAIASSN